MERCTPRKCVELLISTVMTLVACMHTCRCKYRQGVDKVVFVGDLVNKGEQSAEVTSCFQPARTHWLLALI